MDVAYRYQHVTVSLHCLPRCVRSTVSHATKSLLPQYKVNLYRFVAMLLLRNEDQQ